MLRIQRYQIQNYKSDNHDVKLITSEQSQFLVIILLSNYYLKNNTNIIYHIICISYKSPLHITS